MQVEAKNARWRGAQAIIYGERGRAAFQKGAQGNLGTHHGDDAGSLPDIGGEGPPQLQGKHQLLYVNVVGAPPLKDGAKAEAQVSSQLSPQGVGAVRLSRELGICSHQLQQVLPTALLYERDEEAPCKHRQRQ